MEERKVFTQQGTSAAKISVIIPTYNGSRYIAKTLDSVLNQTYNDLEIIIIDDGSTEDLQPALKSYIGQIKYIYSKHRGPAAARNIGVKLCHGTYVAFLDHDDIWSPTNLEDKVHILDNKPQCGMVYSYPELIDAMGDIIPNEHPSSFSQGQVFEDFLERNRITTFSSTLIRKETLMEVGPLDERKELITCDDYDLWLKITDVQEIDFSPDQDVFYRMHEDNLIKNLDLNLRAHMIVFKDALKKRRSVKAIPKLKLLHIILRHLSDKYHFFAYKYYYENRDYDKARALLLRCVVLKPLMIRNWIFLAICLLPRHLIDSMRMIKQRLHGKTA